MKKLLFKLQFFYLSSDQMYLATRKTKIVRKVDRHINPMVYVYLKTKQTTICRENTKCLTQKKSNRHKLYRY